MSFATDSLIALTTPPFSHNQVMFLIGSGRFDLPFPDVFDHRFPEDTTFPRFDHLLALCEGCLQKDSKRRWSLSQVLEEARNLEKMVDPLPPNLLLQCNDLCSADVPAIAIAKKGVWTDFGQALSALGKMYERARGQSYAQRRRAGEGVEGQGRSSRSSVRSDRGRAADRDVDPESLALVRAVHGGYGTGEGSTRSSKRASGLMRSSTEKMTIYGRGDDSKQVKIGFGVVPKKKSHIFHILFFLPHSYTSTLSCTITM